MLFEITQGLAGFLQHDSDLPPSYDIVTQQDARQRASLIGRGGGGASAALGSPDDPFEGDHERERRLRKLVRQQVSFKKPPTLK